ncbi:hypothetical protein HPB50_012396 [Hyalomma asiaticum]|uniref:Uncharacterized protein n=1 Tax=Hyalomma asiaticum TaxID=266040 RepID=A0ACB7RTW1_HYAAI|nr:hypothetical protein HPB50_012396 [Hyalomma asiaticum]
MLEIAGSSEPPYRQKKNPDPLDFNGCFVHQHCPVILIVVAVQYGILLLPGTGDLMGPYCNREKICAYEKTELKCLSNCTCYGQYKAVCVRKLAEDPCTDEGLAIVTPGVAGYKCDRCLSESEVLTAPRGG